MRRVSLPVTCVLTVLGVLLVVPTATASTICQTSLPLNISAGMLQQQMLVLLQRSETFREQCRRIAAAPYVRIRLGIGPMMEGGGRAETVIRRYQHGAIVAFVTMRFAEDYFELIPHELEHVIEQIDGVRLSDELTAQRAWLGANGTFETRRATAAGARVRQELDGLAMEPVEHHGLKAPAPRHPFN